MKCPKCGSKYITVVNQPVQLKEKTHSGTFEYLLLISALSFFIFLIIFIMILLSKKGTPLEELTKITGYAIVFTGLKISSVSLLAIGVLHALRPHKMENRLIGVCMDCGHAAALKEFKRKTEENT